MRDRRLRLLAVLLPLLVVVVLGCSQDEKSTQPGGEDMTSAEFQQEMEAVMELTTADLMECRVAYLIDPVDNADLFEFLQTEILATVADGGDLAQYYGTWDDTSPDRSDGEGIARTLPTPANAVRLMLVGADTLGTPLSGDLTLTGISVEADTLNNVYEVSFDAALREDASGDRAEVALALELIGDPEGNGGSGDFSLELTSSGSVCGVAYDLAVAADNDAVTASGWYQDQIRVGFQSTMLTAGADTSVTATITIGTGTPPRVRLTLAAHPGAQENCLEGSVFVRGRHQADIVATGCGTDEMAVFMVVDADSLPAAEVVGDLWGTIGGLIDAGGVPALVPIALPFGHNPAAGPTSGLGCGPAWPASGGARSVRPLEALPGKPRSRVHPRG